MWHARQTGDHVSLDGLPKEIREDILVTRDDRRRPLAEPNEVLAAVEQMDARLTAGMIEAALEVSGDAYVEGDAREYARTLLRTTFLRAPDEPAEQMQKFMRKEQ